MASLRNIINLDDDHSGPHPLKKQKESAPKAPENSGSLSASPSSYASLAHLSIYSSSPSALALDPVRGQGPPASLHPLHSSPAEASPLPFALPTCSTSLQPGRRPSNASTDSMDSRYNQGRGQGQGQTGGSGRAHSHAHVHAHAHAHHAHHVYGQSHSHSHGHSYSGTPTRPLVSTTGDMPIKLTPVTKRVSRAKKGVPVHVCETFTRAEHLRRHKSSSHQPPDLPCTWPDCEKIFHRKDLLDRHFQKHSSERRTDSDGFDVSSQLSQALDSPSSNPHSSMVGQSHSTPLTSSPWVSNPTSHAMDSHQDDFSLGGTMKSEFSLSAMTSVPTASSTSAPVFSEARPTGLGIDMAISDMAISDVDTSGVTWGEGSAIMSDSRSNFSTPPSDGSRTGAFSVRTSAAEWTGSFGQPALSGSLQSPPMTGGYPMSFYSASPPHLYSPMFGPGANAQVPAFVDDSLYGSPVLNAQVRSLSPHMAMEQSSETLATTAAPLPADRMLTPLTLDLQPETMFGLLTPQDMMPVSPSREALDAVPEYLEVYWDEVSPQYPFIHRGMLDEFMGGDGEQIEVLKCAMAAVAAQFLSDRADRVNGSQLHDFAWQKSKQFTQSGVPWPLPILHAVALCEYYARFRGRNKEAYRPSARFNAACQMVANSQQHKFVDSVPPGSPLTQRWKAWVYDESYRRLHAACFLLSVHGSWYYEQALPATFGLDRFSPMMVSIPLTASTEHLWEADTAQEWAKRDLSPAARHTVGELLDETLTADDIDSMPAFDASILLAAHVLRLPRRANHTQVDMVEDASTVKTADLAMVQLFHDSPSACAYLALHHTPLHWLLSVSGDSWMFNKKVHQASQFAQHQTHLQQWRASGSAVVATVFAARALKLFLHIEAVKTEPVHASALPWRDISDYWAMYVCALVCWAFGRVGRRPAVASAASVPVPVHSSFSSSSSSSPSPAYSSPLASSRAASRRAALRWILAVADLEPGQLQMLSGLDDDAHAVVGLVRDVLEKDCLGGRSLLYTDAVDVLRRLEEVESWMSF